MAEDWAGIAADVVEAIAEVGFEVAIRRKATQGSVPWNPVAPNLASPTCKAIDRKPSVYRISGGAEVARVRALLVGPGANVPVMGDRVTVRGKEHEVIKVDAVAPGGVDLLYIVEIAA